MHDLWVAYALWPRGVIFAGDDWAWRKRIEVSPHDSRRMLGPAYNTTHHAAANVCDFARKANFRVSARGATWLLHPAQDTRAPVRDEVDCGVTERSIRWKG